MSSFQLLKSFFIPFSVLRASRVPGAIRLFNPKRLWLVSVLMSLSVSLIPLIVITMINYRTTEKAFESENYLKTARVVSNTYRSISFFLTERRAALDFISRDNPQDALLNTVRLAFVLRYLEESFGGGFVDLGIIDSSGTQIRYVGPYDLLGKEYGNQSWFQECKKKCVYISDVFLGYRKEPHFVIAVKKNLDNNNFLILRASLRLDIFKNLLDKLELTGRGDAFVINRKGVLQTNSIYYGKILSQVPFSTPEYQPSTQVIELSEKDGARNLIGYRFIEETPFILMIVKSKSALMAPFRKTKTELFMFLAGSIILISGVILGIVTYMVNRIQLADERRLAYIQQVEYANKMASIGRMAAGISHEINNPLAIINEKAGLIKDLFEIKKQYAGDPKLQGMVDVILAAVKRASKITRLLLAFARNTESGKESVDVKLMIKEVLSFIEKEAEINAIKIEIKAPDSPAVIQSDKGKLQQIFLNIINNALDAIEKEGHLVVEISGIHKDGVNVSITDDGVGIKKEDLKHIFEPFFSTKKGRGGTGLGLAITYNLIQELGGTISVESEEEKGSIFSIRLPVELKSDQN
ncbi:MAG: hypothetical protein A2V65_04345 [Deltaproteobacteria bacterium RBG_13_49_15]|nr:MAG: hypothetical protein A2V65_04345 [Deltaproteobacteria bacterium RBG_13_49_15]